MSDSDGRQNCRIRGPGSLGDHVTAYDQNPSHAPMAKTSEVFPYDLVFAGVGGLAGLVGAQYYLYNPVNSVSANAILTVAITATGAVTFGAAGGVLRVAIKYYDGRR